jgi:hypothetical protein
MARLLDNGTRIAYRGCTADMDPMHIQSCAERLDEASWHFLASLAPGCPAALDVGLVALDHRHPRHREVKDR